MRWSERRLTAYLRANTVAATKLFGGHQRPGLFTLVRLHWRRWGWLDHLLCVWLAPLTLGFSAWLWHRYVGSCCFAGFIEEGSSRVGCLIHPVRWPGRDLRHHAFPLVPTLTCDRDLRCPMLDYPAQDLNANWYHTSIAGAKSLRP